MYLRFARLQTRLLFVNRKPHTGYSRQTSKGTGINDTVHCRYWLAAKPSWTTTAAN